jgi:riboflavin biosynthesis pyrimidine reductase
MSVIASLVVAKDGSTIKGGRSSGVASIEDRNRFLARRRKADCIVIGGNTARNEPYHQTPVPVVVISRSMINSLANNRLALWWNTTPENAIARAAKTFGNNILVEAGPTLVLEMVRAGLIDGLELSVTEESGGEDPIDYKSLLKYFPKVVETKVGETTFYSATR